MKITIEPETDEERAALRAQGATYPVLLEHIFEYALAARLMRPAGEMTCCYTYVADRHVLAGRIYELLKRVEAHRVEGHGAAD